MQSNISERQSSEVPYYHYSFALPIIAVKYLCIEVHLLVVFVALLLFFVAHKVSIKSTQGEFLVTTHLLFLPQENMILFSLGLLFSF